MSKGQRLREQMLQQPGQQMKVDLKDAVPVTCECGCKYFTQAVQVHKISALLSPNGQELIAQQPCLICLDCKEVLK